MNGDTMRWAGAGRSTGVGGQIFRLWNSTGIEVAPNTNTANTASFMRVLSVRVTVDRLAIQMNTANAGRTISHQKLGQPSTNSVSHQCTARFCCSLLVSRLKRGSAFLSLPVSSSEA